MAAITSLLLSPPEYPPLHAAPELDDPDEQYSFPIWQPLSIATINTLAPAARKVTHLPVPRRAFASIGHLSYLRVESSPPTV